MLLPLKRSIIHFAFLFSPFHTLVTYIVGNTTVFKNIWNILTWVLVHDWMKNGFDSWVWLFGNVGLAQNWWGWSWNRKLSTYQMLDVPSLTSCHELWLMIKRIIEFYTLETGQGKELRHLEGTCGRGASSSWVGLCILSECIVERFLFVSQSLVEDLCVESEHITSGCPWGDTTTWFHRGSRKGMDGWMF